MKYAENIYYKNTEIWTLAKAIGSKCFVFYILVLNVFRILDIFDIS